MKTGDLLKNVFNEKGLSTECTSLSNHVTSTCHFIGSFLPDVLLWREAMRRVQSWDMELFTIVGMAAACPTIAPVCHDLNTTRAAETQSSPCN